MSKYLAILLVLALFGCQSDKKSQNEDLTTKPDTTVLPPGPDVSLQKVNQGVGNERFRKVTAISIGGNDYLIEGEGQIFEANFGWVVEDGHNELASGFEMTNAGAPEWGRFSFTVEVAKARPNSTLMLILFESSAEDGRRQHELPVVLE